LRKKVQDLDSKIFASCNDFIVPPNCCSGLDFEGMAGTFGRDTVAGEITFEINAEVDGPSGMEGCMFQRTAEGESGGC
jgi:hypothetical protein